MNFVNQLRKHYADIADVATLRRSAEWSDMSFLSARATRSQYGISYQLSTNNQLNLYNPPLRVRRDIRLSEDQHRAAQHSSRPAVIIGPAGCGKSVVITERIINIINSHKGTGPISLLLTTFNKGLLLKLSEWLIELLQKNNLKAEITFDVNDKGIRQDSCTIHSLINDFSIRLLHFDMLPKYLGKVDNKPFNPYYHENLLSDIIKHICEVKKVTQDDYQTILNPNFLLEEYHRVIYGLQCRISEGLDAYQQVTRSGRGSNPSLSKGIRRELVWLCLQKYAKTIYSQGIQSFVSRRQEFLYKIRRQEIKPSFDFIIVDEFQDCTKADFEIFLGLIKNPDNLIIAGDIAQSVHIGRSANIPRDVRMAQRQFFRLKGSYRLPQRISECLLGLSAKIKESFQQKDSIEEISPHKGSPPGARPIVVYAEDVNNLAQKIKSIVDVYSLYNIDKVTVLEKNKDLCHALLNIGLSAETDTILKLKGLEKECIIWSADKRIEFEKEAKEFIYTILTRTSCLLIIAFVLNVPSYCKGIFSLLNTDRLIFWDEESESNFLNNSEPFIEQYGDDEDEAA